MNNFVSFERDYSVCQMINHKYTFTVLLTMLFFWISHYDTLSQNHNDFTTHYEKALQFRKIHMDSVIPYAWLAYLAASERNDTKQQLKSLRLLIKTEIKSGDLLSSIKHCVLADSIAKQNNLDDYLTLIEMYKGVALVNSGLVMEGITILLKLRTIIAEDQEFSDIAELNYYTASANFRLNNLAECKNYLQKAIAKNVEQNDSLSLLNCYILMASSHHVSDSISYWLNKAEFMSLKTGNTYQISALANNKALYYKSIGKFTEARSYYNKSIHLAESNGYQRHLVSFYNNYAYLLLAENVYDSARVYLDKALDLSKELQNIDLEATVLDSYSDYFLAVNDSANALKYFKQSIIKRNQFRDKQRRERAAFLTVVFETNEKEKEIANQQIELSRSYILSFVIAALLIFAIFLLVIYRQAAERRKAKIVAMKQNERLLAAQSMIQGQDNERKRISMDMHDGVSPMLASLNMLTDRYLSDNEKYNDFKQAIDGIHENIREVSHRLVPIDLEGLGLVQSLRNYIATVKEGKNCNISIFSNMKSRFSQQKEYQLYYILYELINNALKYARASEVNIQFIELDNEVSISVEDDGIGFNPRTVKPGMGLKNVRERSSFINGHFTMESEPGKGTVFFIKLAK